MSYTDGEHMERWSDDELLSAAHAGDTTAFRIFCVRCLPSVLRFLHWQCRRCRLPPDLPAELAQEVIVRALAQVRARERDHEPIPQVSSAWLFQIGNHLIQDWIKRKKRQADAYSAKAERLNALAPTEDELEQYEEILKYLNWLPDHARELLELIYLKGMSVTEAGDQMGMTADAAYKAHARALTHLKEYIEEHGRVGRSA